MKALGSSRVRAAPAICAAMTFLAPAMALATTHVVTPGGPVTIQAAIDAAAPGDSVLLVGTSMTPFTGPGNRDIDTRGKALTITGAGSAPVIDCGSGAGFRRGFIIQGGEGRDTVIEHLAITNGSTAIFDSGGAIKCVNASPTIRACRFDANRASVLGTAIHSNGGSPHIVDCVAEHGVTTTSSGGAAAIGCGSGAAVVENCIARSNNGSGISASGSGALVKGCTIEDNIGSALHLGSDAVAEDCVMSGNEGPNGESAVYLAGGTVLRRCTIVGTGVTIEGTVFFGGPSRAEDCVIQGNMDGIVAGGGPVELARCLITGNGPHFGGALRISELVSCRVENCTIAGNRTHESYQGGAIHISHGGSVEVVRSILDGNCSSAGTVLLNESGTAIFECSAFDPSGISGAWTDLGDNTVADPLFCGPRACTTAPTTAGDYEIHVASPCSDAASPCGALIGARDVGCGATPVDETSWGSLKSVFHRE